MPVDIKDPNFLRHAIRNGSWERYEHPTKGSTLTLQLGKFPILSIHELLVDGPAAPIDSFLRDLSRDTETQVLLLAQLAKLQRELQVATKIIAQTAPGPVSPEAKHETLPISMGDGLYSFICTCGVRRDNYTGVEAAKLSAKEHEEGMASIVLPQ